MRSKRPKRRKTKIPQPGGAADWSVVKVYADSREEVVEQGLTEQQAYHLGEHYLVGCLDGETVKLRGPVVFDFD